MASIKMRKPRIAVIDYGMGNLFSIENACKAVGLEAVVTSRKREILLADAVILPGVGAFGDAMETLNKLDIVTVLQEMVGSSKPFFGICLGMQLLMTESQEFGEHRGLGFMKGSVIRFNNSFEDKGMRLKVPHVEWARIYRAKNCTDRDYWDDSLLERLPEGVFMYFVHSFYVVPEDKDVILAVSKYGNTEFCSSIKWKNIFGCQFHPERSGPNGLKIYEKLKSLILEKR